LLDSLSAMPDALDRICALFPQESLRWSPQDWDGVPGEQFSPLGQVCHLRDIERDGYHVRFRRIREETVPSLESLDSYAIAAARDYDGADPGEALAELRAARAATVESLKSLSEGELHRTATFAENGIVTTEGLVHLLCSHDQQHLATLHWLLSRITSPRYTNQA